MNLGTVASKVNPSVGQGVYLATLPLLAMVEGQRRNCKFFIKK